MSSKNKQGEREKVRFSIGVKLILIVTIILVISLGSITALVSWLVRTDLQISAEENNFELNHRSVIAVESELANIRSNSRILIQFITALGSPSAPSSASAFNTRVIRQSIDFFFAENPQIASVFFIVPGRPEQLLVNRNFFLFRELDAALTSSFFEKHEDIQDRINIGETLIQNASPHFDYTLLALYFPLTNEREGALGGILFSQDIINKNFGFGLNESIMINYEGDILSHADSALIHSGTNIANLKFVRSILDSSYRNRQYIMEFQTDDTVDSYPVKRLVTYTKLNAADAIVITSIEYEKIFEGINATTRRNIYLAISILSISIVFIWLFSKTISVPLKSLIGAVQQIENGRFEFNAVSKNKDETGVLINSFGKMCSALHVFGKFSNRNIAVKIMCGELQPEGLPKNSTILFADIREFEAKLEGFKYFGAEASEKIIKWLNRYFSRMVNCIEKTNGAVDKFIGDAVMAHWGAVDPSESPRKDAFNCVKAALMIRKELYYLNKIRRADDPANPFIRIGCGISSGTVTAGQLGNDSHAEYTVIGDPVNLASHIERLTRTHAVDILISEDTWKLAGDKFVCEEMPPLAVSGKTKPVRIFAVINFLGEDKGPKTLDEVRFLLGMDLSQADS
jgi:adenylate cyclase